MTHDEPRFTTEARSLQGDGKVEWGGDGESWESATDTTENVTIENGVVKPTEISDSAVSRWEFERDVTDSWGSNDATDNTSAGYVTGVLGDAKDFDAYSDDEVRVPDNSTVNITDALTLSAWFWPKSNQRDTGTGEKIVAGKSDNWKGAPYQIKFMVDGGMGVSINDGSTDYRLYPSTDVAFESWHHAALTFDGRHVTAYHDGDPVEQEDTGGTTITTDTVDFVIGNNRNGYRRYFNGYVDDVRLYDVALTDQEVNDLYDAGSS